MIVSKEIQLETARGLAAFEVPQLNGVQATKLFIRLTNKLGPALANAKSAGNLNVGLIGALLERLDPEEYERIQNELLARVVARFPETGEVDSNAVRNLGEIFTGHPFELVRLVLFALEVNFGSFFERLRAAVSKALENKTAAGN
jgi:hypothetical protein